MATSTPVPPPGWAPPIMKSGPQPRIATQADLDRLEAIAKAYNDLVNGLRRQLSSLPQPL